MEAFCGRFLQKVFVKDFAAEGFRKVSGRIPEGSGPSALSFPNSERFLQKVFAEGSAEGFCGRFCGRFPEGFSRKVQKLVSSINIVLIRQPQNKCVADSNNLLG